MNTIAILFPNGNAARLLGTRLLLTGNKVIFYCPEEGDFKLAANMIEEMTILASDAAEPTKDRALARPGIGNSLFSVQTGEDFKGVDVIVLVSLDVFRSKTDAEYIILLENHFHEMKRRGFSVGNETKIVFGGNQSGLIAGSVWAKIWPGQQGNIIVGSSLYDASMKVFGQDSGARSLPLVRRGEVFFNGKKDQKIVTMGRAEELDDYSTLEARVLDKIIALITREENFDELEFIGKCPTQKEAEKYNIPEGKVAWVPQIDVLWYPAYWKAKFE